MAGKTFKTFLLFLSLVFGINVAYSAPLPSGIEEQNRRIQQEADQNRRARQEAEERQQREQKKDVFLQQKPQDGKDTSLPEESPSFVINVLKLEGESIEQFPWAQKMLDQYTGRKIGMQGINLIVKRLTNAFIDRGYVTTRVLVPEQDLSSGILRLTLIPGKIRDIRFQDPKTRGNWRTAFPARPGDILNLRNLEQGLEQMKRVASQDVDMQLVPGDKPGESDVVISAKRKRPWKVVQSLDDSGVKDTGKLQVSETFSVDNPLGINDLFNVSFNSDADREGARRGTRSDSVYYSFPQGNSTYTFSASSYKYHQIIESSTQPFLSSGESHTTEFKVSELLHRDQTRKTYLEYGIIQNRSRSYIDDTEIEVQRKDTTAAKLGISHRQYFGETTVNVLLAYKKGVSWFGAQADPADEAPDTATTRYGIWTFDASLSTPVTIGKTKCRYNANLRAQYTDDLLFGSEYFSIGNRYTVRGFDGEQTLSAEKGWYIQSELSIPLEKAGMEAYLGLDYGQVTGPGATSLTGRILAGSVVGLRGGNKNIQYDVFVGWPLRKPEDLKTATPTYGFQLIYQI